MDDFQPTHVIELSDERVPVMLVPSEEGGSIAYTEGEWSACSAADFEVDEQGNWLFQGQPFDDTVTRL